MSEPLLSSAELAATAESIASVQLANGMIPWFPGGHGDPWNHTEAAVALVVAGGVAEAEAAYGWLASTQLPDGSWCLYHLAEGIEEPRRDPNVCAYVAAGLWWHYLETGDERLLRRMWPVVSGAIEFVLGLQTSGGEVLWNRDVDGHPGSFALLTGNSSTYHSLRCAVAIAGHLGFDRPDWELAAGRVGHAVAHRSGAFEIKDRWAMDWYYPVFCGAVREEAARDRMEARWDAFVMADLGVRCVVHDPWVTAAETAECVMALDAAGLQDQAVTLLDPAPPPTQTAATGPGAPTLSACAFLKGNGAHIRPRRSSWPTMCLPGGAVRRACSAVNTCRRAWSSRRCPSSAKDDAAVLNSTRHVRHIVRGTRCLGVGLVERPGPGRRSTRRMTGSGLCGHCHWIAAGRTSRSRSLR
ncbi:MAG: hypothetical protein M3256_07125 [Actinomycetota bacterium]|nr:hypothetical protein [Actinomycetota bacterium]